MHHWFVENHENIPGNVDFGNLDFYYIKCVSRSVSFSKFNFKNKVFFHLNLKEKIITVRISFLVFYEPIYCFQFNTYSDDYDYNELMKMLSDCDCYSNGFLDSVL